MSMENIVTLGILYDEKEVYPLPQAAGFLGLSPRADHICHYIHSEILCVYISACVFNSYAPFHQLNIFILKIGLFKKLNVN